MEGSTPYLDGHDGPDNLEVMPLIDPEDMLPHYKWARWLVGGYQKLQDTVGWKVSAGEAWAAGTGVCLPAIRPDLVDYVGDAGLTYVDPAELPEIVSEPVATAHREAGFEKAKTIQ